MRHIALSSLAFLVLPYFYKLSQKQQEFRKKVTEHKMCFDFFYNFCLIYFSFLRITERHILTVMSIDLYVQYRYFCEILIKFEFSQHI